MIDLENRFGISFVRILGIPISIVSMEQVLALFESWVADRCDRSVVVRDVHGLMLAREDIKLWRAHEESELITPDGVPLVWVARMVGINGISRVCGPDLLPAACQHGLAFGWRHFFLGGKPGIAESLIERMVVKYPGISIAGFHSPPFRTLTEEEDELICAKIRASKADLVWVGLGTPKQEIWMLEHRGLCGGAIMLSVGAAFDFHAGSVSRAPKWMQYNGLEWIFRLVQEPKRLWRRYLVLAPTFVILALLELVRYHYKMTAKSVILRK